MSPASPSLLANSASNLLVSGAVVPAPPNIFRAICSENIKSFLSSESFSHICKGTLIPKASKCSFVLISLALPTTPPFSKAGISEVASGFAMDISSCKNSFVINSSPVVIPSMPCFSLSFSNSLK